MKIEKAQVFGFEPSIRAMRNPLDSWDKSDSYLLSSFKHFNDTYEENIEEFVIGKDDISLSQRLSKAGNEHCKHLRMIQTWVDLTLPRYICTEFDTYQHINKVSFSTMHTLMKIPLNADMFEDGFDYMSNDQIETILQCIKKYNNTQDSNIKKQNKYIVKSLLPESFLQKRTINTNYQCLLNIFNQRSHHELPQWHDICNWILMLPYFIKLTGIKEEQRI
jgi:hypothetical protein